MSIDINNYSRETSDWRNIISINSRRTYLVLATFFLIYAALGVLVDMFIASSHYPQADLSTLFYALITFKITPIATIIALAVAAIFIMVTFEFHDKLMLLGTEYREITPQTATTLTEKQLYNVVEEMKVSAGLRYMPKVFIIDAEYMNAFASGYSEKSAMVAITRGLMDKLDRDELQAVMAHELSHIRHMDIKLTLMASVLCNLTLMILDMLFYSSISSRDDREEGNKSRNQLYMIMMILRIVLPFITVLLMLYLSRTREYMADAGSVQLMRTNEPMARALLKIQQDHEQNQESYSAQYQQTPHESVRRQAYIFDPVQAGVEPVKSLTDAFSTHPNIRDRLAALGFKFRDK